MSVTFLSADIRAAQPDTTYPCASLSAVADRLGTRITRLSLLLGLFTTGTFAWAGPLQLNEALRLAATEHPTVAASRSERQAALMQLDVAERQRYPNLVAQSAGNAVGERITTLRIEQPLWTGGRITGEIKVASATIRRSEALLLQAQQDIMLWVIQAPDGGVLEELLVREGALVQRGELLARLEKTKVEAGYQETKSRVGALSATVSRLRAEVFGGEPKFDPESSDFQDFRRNQLDLLKKRRGGVRQELQTLERMRNLASKELRMTEPLLAAGDVSMADVLKLQRQVADFEGQMTNRQNKYLQESQAELNKAEEELSAARQMLVQRKDQLANTDLRAPLNGTVKNVRITTRGGVLRPGDELMQIVPVEDKLIVEAKVKPSDIAFLKPGLDVTVKIDAYDFSIYGGLHGTLTYLSPDTLSEDLKQGEQPSFRVQVTTDASTFNRRQGETLTLQPGMTATIEVKTGHNTVLKYLLKPVIKTLNESMGER